MKTIEFTSQSKPEDKIVYGDSVKVFDGTNIIHEGTASTCPNPFRPSDMTPWLKCYAMLALGTYKGKCIEKHPKFGKCILINNGGECNTVNSNSKHDGRHVAFEVFIHHGFRPDWRGSMACLTIPPNESKKFFDLFADGEEVEIAITSNERMA